MKQLLLLNPELENRKTAVFGTDRTALRLFSMLLQNNVYVDCFVSLQVHPTKLQIMNKPVVSINDFKEKKEMALVVANPSYQEQAKKLEQDGCTVFYDWNLASYDEDCIFL